VTEAFLNEVLDPNWANPFERVAFAEEYPETIARHLFTEHFVDYADAWNRYPPEGGEELCGDIDADRFRHLILNSAPVFPGVRDLVARAVRNFWIRRAAFHVEAASNDPAKEAAHAKAAEQYESDFRHAESELADSLGEGSDTVERSGDTPAWLERTKAFLVAVLPSLTEMYLTNRAVIPWLEAESIFEAQYRSLIDYVWAEHISTLASIWGQSVQRFYGYEWFHFAMESWRDGDERIPELTMADLIEDWCFSRKTVPTITAEKPRLLSRADVKALLSRTGLTPSGWAQKGGYDPSVAYDYLNGRSNPRPSTRNDLAQVLGLTGEDLPV
jgi:hypothetical protein